MSHRPRSRHCPAFCTVWGCIGRLPEGNSLKLLGDGVRVCAACLALTPTDQGLRERKCKTCRRQFCGDCNNCTDCRAMDHFRALDSTHRLGYASHPAGTMHTFNRLFHELHDLHRILREQAAEEVAPADDVAQAEHAVDNQSIQCDSEEGTEEALWIGDDSLIGHDGPAAEDLPDVKDAPGLTRSERLSHWLVGWDVPDVTDAGLAAQGLDYKSKHERMHRGDSESDKVSHHNNRSPSVNLFYPSSALLSPPAPAFVQGSSHDGARDRNGEDLAVSRAPTPYVPRSPSNSYVPSPCVIDLTHIDSPSGSSTLDEYN